MDDKESKFISISEEVIDEVPLKLRQLPAGVYKLTKLSNKDKSQKLTVPEGLERIGTLSIIYRAGGPCLNLSPLKLDAPSLMTSVIKGIVLNTAEYLLVETLHSVYRIEKV